MGIVTDTELRQLSALFESHPQLPDIDGITVTEKIRLEEKGSEKRIPIIAYTFSSERKYKKRCLLSGMDSFTRKPIPVIELESIIGNFLFS